MRNIAYNYLIGCIILLALFVLQENLIVTCKEPQPHQHFLERFSLHQSTVKLSRSIFITLVSADDVLIDKEYCDTKICFLFPS